ncbi:hypothetical protein YYC_04130 [Plasmodium yoelii 17X]|uniref:YIR protein n=1 Tax=Plasmodium yoelii 17X TaxID=1323249 RepID=V7PGY0_PLAYE|nr:hypothetical protein YYC_04130 [Plasmodium yoelii 17X]
MNDFVCRKFLFARNWFPDRLTNGEYKFVDDKYFKEYCTSNSWGSDLEKINAVCLYLFDEFFKDYSVFNNNAKSNINIVEYIMIWLSYMLNLKKNEPGITNLQHFYTTYINNEKYKKLITDVKEYKNYKELIDKKTYFLNMNSNITSNFYEAFKLLCEMYTNFDENKSHCSNCSENANKFVNKYNKMNQNYDITSNSSYKELLSTLSNDYNNFKNYYTSKCSKCKEIPSLLSVEKMQISAHSSGHVSEDTSSSSSTTTKLFTVLSIFGAIAFFLGISYKYSLFGFRKRAQKQKLREKIKNIKKKMNH